MSPEVGLDGLYEFFSATLAFGAFVGIDDVQTNVILDDFRHQTVDGAARSRDESPVLEGAWLPAGATVVSLGATLPEQREVDEATLARAACIVADVPDEVAHDTGDGIAAARAGIDINAKLASLAALACGTLQARRDPQDIVLYKSVGSALQDVVIAEMILERARKAGLGTLLPDSIAPVAK